MTSTIAFGDYYPFNVAVPLGNAVHPLHWLPGETFCDASDGALALCPCGNAGDPDTGCKRE